MLYISPQHSYHVFSIAVILQTYSHTELRFSLHAHAYDSLLFKNLTIMFSESSWLLEAARRTR